MGKIVSEVRRYGNVCTICFDKAYECPECKGKIDSVQVKEFENMLENFHIGDCVGHVEDVRIIKDEL